MPLIVTSTATATGARKRATPLTIQSNPPARLSLGASALGDGLVALARTVYLYMAAAVRSAASVGTERDLSVF